MIAASVPNSEPILNLLLQRGADVNIKNNNGQVSKSNITTPFLQRHTPSTPQAYPPVKRLTQPPLQSALHFVASKKNLDVARLLLAANPPASTRVRDRRGQYPIHRAAAVGSVPMVTLLLRNRSPLNAADGEGFTPLHHAVAEGHDFTLKNNDGELAIDLAPDQEVRHFIIQGAEREGISLVD
ncbi:ankyrin [Trichoderma longibrachiatum ATCC 18648]|uniref:Ankyrin n=1 Tax=Trichoderma longibrachiatum ATCC 18648 TaxID=983965 RepID=A0A2T4CH10_TRILO|nr:ankyrin [Trichoderma longibrachiatum ATCC 18648]